MPAASTDKFVKGSRKLAGTIDASGISDASIDNFGLSSVAGLATDTAVEITVDRVDANGAKTPALEETIRGIVSGGRIISAVRGVEGTAQSHAAGAVWEVRLTASMWNRLIDGLLTFATQTGKLILSAMDGSRYAADAGGDDTYAVTLDPVPAAYYAGMEVNFKPITANTGACTLDVNGLGAKTIKKNVSSDLSTGDILAGQIVKVIYDGTNFQLVSTIPAAALNAPEGSMQNGKISVTDSGSGIVLAVKTFAGTDPSATDPVSVVIGGVVRSITGALSVTVADGTNIMNLGSAELATKEADLFAHLFWKAADSSVVLGFARITGNLYSDFSGTNTNEKYIAVSATPAATDACVVIGRFAATLSAGAGYTWSVPTYTALNLIQRPIYESRWLDYVPQPTASAGSWGSQVGRAGNYQVRGDVIFYSCYNSGTTTTTPQNIRLSLPFTPTGSFSMWAIPGYTTDNGTAYGSSQEIAVGSALIYIYKYNFANYAAAAAQVGRSTGFFKI